MTDEMTLPPLPEDPDWHDVVSEAAEEVAAWMSPGPTSDRELETAVLWFQRLRHALGELCTDEANLDRLFNAEGSWSAYCHAAVVAARDDALRTLEYAMRLREALAGVMALDGSEPQGLVDAAFAAASVRLRENPPAPSAVPWSLAEMDEVE